MLKETDFHGWHAVTLTTGQVELVIPREVGPRIISCSLAGGDNLFAVKPEQLGKGGEGEWMIRGGHRIWHSPEHPVRTMLPDNAPITVESTGDTVLLTQETEAATGLQKQIQIDVVNGTTFRVTHTLHNRGLWPVRCAVWALSVMKAGGYGTVALPPKGDHSRDLLPTMAIVPWTYTNLAHPVWNLRNEYIGIDSPKATVSQKLGLTNYRGWSAYWQEAGTFVKFSQVKPGVTYPDMGCCFETYNCDWMVEMETLGPEVEIPLGGSAEHVEYWGVLKGLQRPDTDEVYASKFRPVIEHWLEHTPV